MLQRVVKLTVIPYDEVSRVERTEPPAFLNYSEGLRFRSDRDEWDRRYFSLSPGRMDEVVEALRKHGVTIR